MGQSLTVVLPVFNCERQLRSSVLDILDLAQALPSSLAIVIVDDGSTDDTFETACELQRHYPQVTVLRQSVRQGMGAALDLVRNRLNLEQVVVHDGVSPIDAAQLQEIFQIEYPQAAAPPVASATESSGSRRFASVRALHQQMETAHRTATFRWIQLGQPLVPRRRQRNKPAMPSPGPQAPIAPITPINLPLGMNQGAPG